MISNNLPELKDDLEGFKYITNPFNKKKLKNNYNLKYEIPFNDYENNILILNLTYSKLKNIYKNKIFNNIFTDFYRNNYITNILSYHSINMNIFSNLFFKNTSNFKL